MADLHVAEYRNLQTDAMGRVMAVAAEPSLNDTVVSYTTATNSVVFHPDTRYVYLQTDGAKAYVSFGTAPTATINSKLIVADDGRFFGVPAGQSFRVSAYDGSS